MNKLSKISIALLVASGLSACAGLPPMPVNLPATTTSNITSKPSKKPRRPSAQAQPEEVISAVTPLTEENLIPAIAASQDIKNDLWERLPKGFKFNVPSHQPQVQAQIAWFMQHQGYLNRTTGRAAPYMYYIVQRIEERNLPVELALLPIIESAYFPLANSGVGATGLWQLMPGTANKFGLKQNLWYDGRRDIFASTNAALDYFTYLENYFDGNWLLAIAAYNAGEGTIQEAVRRNAMQGKPTDFWSLPLPAETMSYVPRLLALAEIIRHRNHYGINLPPISDQPYLTQIAVKQRLPLQAAAQMAGMGLPELKQLNPGYKGEPHAPYHLTLPIDRAAVFKEQLAEQDKPARQAAELAMAEKTDTVSTTVVTTNTIEQPATSNTLPEPEESSAAEATSSQDQDAATVTPLSKDEHAAHESVDEDDNAEDISAAVQGSATNPAAAEPKTHLVKTGETLFKLAKTNHTSVEQIRKWNNLKADQAIKPGVKLIVGQEDTANALLHKGTAPKKAPKASLTTAASGQHNHKAAIHSYIVQSGDTLTSIAKQFDIKASTLQRLNHLNDTHIHPGQKLVVQ